ncbi:unnamed protein product [Notodromas monacha]|uniref:Sodium-coupled monocarboxylate transporter 2 n=1 Tax=Notodromas monacha TaxID=399045 RepID=A0A7R9BVZ6_9CRUS|nr:unnamed protein product [Notodromas monacha]CAG0921419.1 unnamed protein product [Notodromas monacha]
MILVTQLLGCPNNRVTKPQFGGLGIGKAKNCPGWRLDQPAFDDRRVRNCVVYGLISIGLSFIAGKFGGVLQVCITVTSVLAAPALTLFVAAVLLPFVNVPGVFAGSAVSLFVSGFLGFGSYIDGVPGPVPLKSFVEICPPDWDVSEIAFSNSSVSAPVEDWNELGFRKIFRISYLLYMCTGLLFGLIVTIITSLATGGYPEDQIDSSIVHSWSIDFFKWLKAKSGISKISHTSASSYNFELKNAGMAGSKSTETMYPTASTATLVTRVGEDTD